MYSIENLSFSYEGRDVWAVSDLNLNIEKGDFLLLMGGSGSGKTTFLRLLKSTVSPKGEKKGRILFCGREISEIDFKTQSEKIGFVGQNPEHGIVCDKVWHELAFGLESLGINNDEIRLRTAEIASFFGIEDWFYKNTSELSGGQKQILNIASVMVTRPEILILDEPASRLDPIAAGEFYRLLMRINSELGTAIVMSTHTADGVFEHCNKVTVLEAGRVIADGTPAKAAKELFMLNNAAFLDMPAQVRISAELNPDREPAVFFKDAKKILFEKTGREGIKNIRVKECKASDEIISVKELHFKYDKKNADILSGLNLSFQEGRHTAIVGGNGAGKTTFLQILCGIKKAYRGDLKLRGERKIAMLSQNPQDIFCFDTVREELAEMSDSKEEIEKASRLFELNALLDSHPFDLSGGEQQRAAFAKVFLSGADIFLLDEPTKGMDCRYKQKLGEIITILLKNGKTIVTVSHDLDFCAEYADYCALLFQGRIAAFGEVHEFFDGNSFYTTSANRISKGIVKKAITVPEVIGACLNESRAFKIKNENLNYKKKEENTTLLKKEKPFYKRKINYLSFLPLLILVPLTLWAGFKFFDDRRYYFISLLLIAEAAVPFFFNMERERPPAREIVLMSVFCAAATAGRVAFFMVPQFSALGAVVIISGICFGPQRGFLVGAVSIFLSNMFIGQGSWTPYQMTAMGMVGLAAGLLKPVISGKILPAAGSVLILTIYGLIMNIASVLMSQPSPKFEMFISAVLLGVPFDLIHAASTFIFLALTGGFMIKKTKRVITKYDMTD